MGSPTQVAAGDRQPAAVAAQLSRIGAVCAGPTSAARRELRVADFTVDPSTRLPGVSVLRQGDHDLLVIDLSRAAGTLSLRLGPMAQQLHLRPEDLWRALLRMRQNVAVLAPLWRQELGDEQEPPPQLAELRRQLREAGEGALWSDDTGGKRSRVFVTWMLPDADASGRPLRVVVPMSEQFRSWELAQRGAALTREAGAVARRLDGPVDALRTRTEWLTSTQTLLADALTGTLEATARVATLEALVRGCLEHPEAGAEHDPDDRASLGALLAQVEAFAGAVGATLTSQHSPSPAVVQLLRDEREHADQLFAALEDPLLKATVADLIAYGPRSPQGDLNHAAMAVCDAAVALLASPSAGATAYERYVVPLMQALGGADLVEVGQPTVVDQLARLAALVPAVAGNVPGPSAMCLSIVQAGTRFMLPRAIAAGDAALLARRMTGVLGRVLGFNAAERTSLSELVAAKKVPEVQDYIDSRFQAGRVSNGMLAVVHIALLLAAVEDGVPDTLAAWNTVLSSGTQLTSASLQFVRGAEAVSKSGLGVGLGFLTGVAAGLAIVVSAEAAYNDDRVGDSTGVALNVVGALGALASFAGWAITFGAFTSLEGFGIPLLVVGAVLSVGVAAAQWIRDATTPGPQRLFTAYLLALESGNDHLSWVLRATAREEPVNPAQQGLATAYRELLDGHRDAAWAELAHDRDLARVFHDQFGVKEQALAVLFDLDEEDLTAFLQR